MIAAFWIRTSKITNSNMIAGGHHSFTCSIRPLDTRRYWRPWALPCWRIQISAASFGLVRHYSIFSTNTNAHAKTFYLPNYPQGKGRRHGSLAGSAHGTWFSKRFRQQWSRRKHNLGQGSKVRDSHSSNYQGGSRGCNSREVRISFTILDMHYNLTKRPKYWSFSDVVTGIGLLNEPGPFISVSLLKNYYQAPEFRL